ncbi:MAG: hypothetical protein ACPF95_02070, partial [Flavobacteriaceae bacterium]
IYGRSDATLNRHGVRIGTAELYAALDQLQEITDSLVVHLLDETQDKLVLFVQSQSEIEEHKIKVHIRNT